MTKPTLDHRLTTFSWYITLAGERQVPLIVCRKKPGHVGPQVSPGTKVLAGPWTQCYGEIAEHQNDNPAPTSQCTCPSSAQDGADSK